MPWSDWQDGFLWDVPVAPSTIWGQPITAGDTFVKPIDSTKQALFESTTLTWLRAADAAGHPSNITIGAQPGEHTSLALDLDGAHYSTDGTDRVEIAQLGWAEQGLVVEAATAAAATAPATYPPAVDPATLLDIPSGDLPGTGYVYGGKVHYETDHVDFDAWRDITITDMQGVGSLDHADLPYTHPGTYAYKILASTSLPSLTPTGFADHSVPIAFPASGGWVDVRSYSEVGEITLPNVFDPATVSGGTSVPATTAPFDLTIPLSTATDGDLSIVMISTFAIDDPFTLPDFPVGSRVQYVVSHLIWDGAHAGFWSGVVPTARMTTPRWRYWVGGPLRTVGDHFRSVGGADIKSLQADGVWETVRRGT